VEDCERDGAGSKVKISDPKIIIMKSSIHITLILGVWGLFMLLALNAFGQAPPRPGAFTQSKTPICQGEIGIVYSISAVSSATSYTWTISGANTPLPTITGGGLSITLNVSGNVNPGNYTLSVVAMNAIGNSPPRTLTLAVNPASAGPTVNTPLINAGQLATLTADGCNGKVNWYAGPAGGIPLDTNKTSYATTPLYENTFYYANCTGANGCASLNRARAVVNVVPGEYEWAKTSTRNPAEPGGRVTNAEGRYVLRDATGNVFVYGTLTNSFDYTHNGITTWIQAQNRPGSPDMFLMKLDSTGTLLWAKTFGMVSIYDELLGPMVLAPSGHLYVLGHSSGGDGGSFKYDGTTIAGIHSRGKYILKINPANGALVWVKNTSYEGGFINTAATGLIAVNSTHIFSFDQEVANSQSFNGPRLFGAQISTTDTDTDNYLDQKRWTLDGGWFQSNGNLPGAVDGFTNVKLVNGGNSLIVAGWAFKQGYDIMTQFVCRLNNINTNTPTLAWMRQFDRGTSQNSLAAIDVDAQDNIYGAVSIGFSPSLYASPTFTFAGQSTTLAYGVGYTLILKYDVNGNEIWSLVGAHNQDGRPIHDLVSDGTNVFLAQSHYGLFTIGGKTYTRNQFIAKIRPDKTVEWLTGPMNPNESNPVESGVDIRGISVRNGRLIMTGILGNSPNFGPDIRLEAAGSTGLMLAKLNTLNSACGPQTAPAATVATSQTLCKGQQNVPFSVSGLAGQTYRWVYRGRGLTLNSNTGAAITLNVTDAATTDTLYCVPRNGCGVGPARKFFIYINPNTPTAVLSGIEPVNFPPEGKLSMQVSMTGAAPWTFTLTDGSSYTATQSPFLIQKTGVTTTRSYQLAAFRDAVCPAGLRLGEVYITGPVCLSNAVSMQANGAISVPTLTNLEPEFTMEAWIQPATVVGEQAIIGFDNCEFFDGAFHLGIQDGFLVLYGKGTTQRGTTIRIDPDVWTHLAVSYNRTDGRVMIHKNGVLFVNQLYPDGYGGNVFTFGNPGLNVGGTNCRGRNFYGLIDEVRVWNLARTTSEIRQYMSSPITGAEDDLMLYYSMNRSGTGAGLSVLNLATTTGAANNGTTVGPISFLAICPAPTQPGSITASQASACREGQVIYTVPAVANVVYSWSYTGSDVVIQAIGNMAILSFGLTATSGQLRVVASNPSGSSVARSLSVTVGSCGGSCYGQVPTLSGVSSISTGNLGDFSGNGTISFWMKPNTYTGGNVILSTSDVSDASLKVLFNPANGSLGLYDNERYSYSNHPFSSTWQHVVITWDINPYYYEARQVKTYVDGIYLGPLQIFGSYALFNNLNLGGNLAGRPSFDGSLDEVAIWTKQFLPDELMALRNTSLTGSEPNLKYLYKLNHSGSGPGIAVTNSATATAGQYTGTTMGNVIFSNRNASGGLTSVQSGLWNNPTTWSCSQIPAAGDVVTIIPGHIVSIGAGVVGVCQTLRQHGRLVFGTGGRLRLGQN
jgi:hypothetical protein